VSKDKYSSFAELAAGEDAGAYRIVSTPRGSAAAIIAPHGGNIEPGTSELARAVAGRELSLYLFEGRKEQANSTLHITSTSFDAPHAFELVGSAASCVAFHGERGEAEAVIYIGGRDETLANAFKEHLHAAAFEVRVHENPNLQGKHPQNICNRTQSGSGVQLELSKALRLELFPSLDAKGRAARRKRFYELVRASRAALGLLT
jgi:phage replication-related protein YjqB (UPF0714/DUF867 family)